MATLEFLKRELRRQAESESSHTRSLSDAEYGVGFELVRQSLRQMEYRDFIIPELAHLLGTWLKSNRRLTVLEIGPGPQSVLGGLPHRIIEEIGTYIAYEPNLVFASRLEQWLKPVLEAPPFSGLQSEPQVHRAPFGLFPDDLTGAEKFDLVLFCHSMYGMKPRRAYAERALQLVRGPNEGMVVICHRDGSLNFGGLTSKRTLCLPSNMTHVPDTDQALDNFSTFITGYAMQDTSADADIKAKWRETCRDLGHRESGDPSRLSFRSPSVMIVFTMHATALSQLATRVPTDGRHVKTREARLQHPAAILRPTEIEHIQHCVRWARDHATGLTIIGGGHSAQCLQSHIPALDMSNFNKVDIVPFDEGRTPFFGSKSLVVAEAGCTGVDIIQCTMAAGGTVPMGSRPSVGAGLWLQGGLGHLTRLHGLTSDAIVGAVLVSVDDGAIVCVGHVPVQHRPPGAVLVSDADLLWAIRGAGTNIGVVLKVVFEMYPAPTYRVRNWVTPLGNALKSRLLLGRLDDEIARLLPRNCSMDLYLYWDQSPYLGVTMFEDASVSGLGGTLSQMRAILGDEISCKTVNAVESFDAEMYITGMHGGHAGKTSSFKRCVFLHRDILAAVSDVLAAAIESRPTSRCYLHLLQGGGALNDVPDNATAFGCRDWDFACVVTAVWGRDLDDGTKVVGASVQWVHHVVGELLPFSSGVYGADLGSDPRDLSSATRAFGPNLARLRRLKSRFDPANVLAYACPLPEVRRPRLIILVTGKHGVGKDYCASAWTALLHDRAIQASVRSISEATKYSYARASGASVYRLLQDREYKEQHRERLSTFFADQLRQRPHLLEEHFLDVLDSAGDGDVLLITGMRDQAPVTTFSHMVPDSRLLEVRIQSKDLTAEDRGVHVHSHDPLEDDLNKNVPHDVPSLTFDNDTRGRDAVDRFAEKYLLPLFHDDFERLNGMIRRVPAFPREDINFHHVLGIAEQRDGLLLCTRLLESHFSGDWAEVGTVVACEAGGFIFASALAVRRNLPLALVREAGKLPPPTAVVTRSPSHISCSSGREGSRRMELSLPSSVVPGASVVVIDDVLATGKTLVSVLQLLEQIGVDANSIHVIVVVEFPVHRGRELLCQTGFGKVGVQSLLVCGGR